MQAEIPIMGIIPLAQGNTVCVYAKADVNSGSAVFQDGNFGGFKLA